MTAVFKKRVQYIGDFTLVPMPRGICALLTPMDHPDGINHYRGIHNDHTVLTSLVVNVNHDNGDVETLNTLYYRVPLPALCGERDALLAQ